MGNRKRQRERNQEFQEAREPLVIAIPPQAKFYCERHDVFFWTLTAAKNEMQSSVHGPATFQCPCCFKRKKELDQHKSELGNHTLPFPWRKVPWTLTWAESWRETGVVSEEIIEAFEGYYGHEGNDEDVRVLVIRMEAGMDVSSVIPKAPGSHEMRTIEIDA